MSLPNIDQGSVFNQDNISSETAQVIEGELGNLLSSFCCNSNKDQRILYDMFKKHNMKVENYEYLYISLKYSFAPGGGGGG